MEQIKRYLPMLGAALAVILLLVYRLSSGAEGEFLEAHQAFHRGDKMDLHLKKHPELETAFRAALTQRAIAKGDTVTESPRDNSIYGRFAEATLLINAGQKEEALASAQALQKELKPSALSAFNLMRIAYLAKELNLGEEKATALKTLEESKQMGYLAQIRDGSLALSEFVKQL